MKNNNCVQCGPYQIGREGLRLLGNPWKRRLHFIEWDTDWATHLGGSIQFFKTTICYDHGCNDIGVVIATKWHYFLFNLQQYISALGPVLPKSKIPISYIFRLNLTNINRYWRKKLSWTILVEQVPVPRYSAASKIGNSVISLLWQLRCHCNPDHNKLSSLSNTTAVAIFPNICLWRRSLCSNLGGIDPKNCIEPP